MVTNPTSVGSTSDGPVPEEVPPPIRHAASQLAAGTPPTLEAIYGASEWRSLVSALRLDGVARVRDKSGAEHTVIADVDAQGNVLALAAAVPRNPGTSIDFIRQIADFQTSVTEAQGNRREAVALFRRIYRAEGPINNAINKMAALVASRGRFKVASVRGQRGKRPDAVAMEAETLANWWKDNVNARDMDSAITGDRGISSFIARGTRLTLIEGDHFARQNWTDGVTVPQLKGQYSLPMNLQSLSSANIEMPVGFEGTDFEVFYWVPPAQLLNQIRNATDPQMAKVLRQVFAPKVLSEIKRTGKYLLDRSLLIHIKNRGTGTSSFGESAVEPALSDIRYKRALDALEITTITNLINRMVILKVGSDDPESVYHSAEVSTKRLSLLQRLISNVGPSSMVLWAGPDLNVLEVSAHNSILALDERYKIAERRILMALGVPVVLLLGEGNSGKAAGYAAALGVAAQLREIQDQYAGVMRSIAERIAFENGFEDIEIVWEWHDNLLQDEETAANLVLKAFEAGLLSTHTALEELGFNYGAERARQDEEVKDGVRPSLFSPRNNFMPNPNGSGGERGGRPPNKERMESDPRDGTEMRTTEENR